MKRRIVAAGLLLLSAATVLFAAQTAVVVTVDGQRLEGEVTETAQTVSIVRGGITSVFARDEVASIDYDSYAVRFENALAALKPDDVEGRLALAREAFERREYGLAQRAVEEAIDINPLNRAAMELSRSISNQITLEGMARKSAATTASTTRPDRSTVDKRRYRGLSPDQINIVRQFELRKGDQVRIQFKNNARKAFVDSQPGLTFREFSRLTDVDQALQILKLGPVDVQRDVVILSDPQSIRTFSRRLNTAVIQGCATSACHGGTGAGDFRLLSGTPDMSTLVTNFYLLTTYRKTQEADGSPFGAGELSMIDRTTPRDSLLYQYALPRAKASVKHPQVREWDGIVNNVTDRFIVDLEEWISHEISPVRPDYGFTFTPGGNSATKPAQADPSTSPSTQPAE
jgi:hypothetical protein